MKLDDVQKLATFKFHHTPEDQAKMREALLSIGIDPANLYQELEMASLYVDTHRDTSYPNTPMSLHSHAFYEILYCRKAEGVEYLVGSERYRLRSGDIIFISPGISHRPILPPEMKTPYVRDVVWISEEYITALKREFTYEPVEANDYLIRTAGTRWEFLEKLFWVGIRETDEKRAGWETAVIGNTLLLLSYLNRAYREHSAGMMTAEKPELLDNVTAYIEEHYTEHITVSDLSRRFFVSDSSISHIFKQKMGVSIYHYITQRRLIAAKSLIAAGLALEHVATQVGFSDYSAFYRAFKQEYGISPRQFKNL